ncbi:MAG: integrin alpha [Candidatus Wenzhouxiangella sp. M2_3B_020]
MATRSTHSINPFAAALLAAAACAVLGGPARASSFVEPDVTVLYALAPDRLGGSFGFVAETIGDLDADGVTEFIVGQPSIDATGLRSGQVHIFSGADGSPLHSIAGLPLDFFGTSVTGLGDVTGDGVPDYAASAPGIPVFFGFPWPASVRVFSGSDHALVYQVDGAVGSRFGQDINNAGDITGDGRDDLIVGAPFDDSGAADAGRAQVFDGATGGHLWARDGSFAGDSLGGGVSSVDDLDGDGIPEQAVGAFNAGPAGGGLAQVLSGADGTLLDILAPLATAGSFGQFFAHDAGDVDGDGTGDIYIGDFGDSLLGPFTGRAYVYSGADRSVLHVLDGDESGGGFGIGRGAGDVNGDGDDDLFLAAYLHDDGAFNAGKGYVYSGRDGGVMRTYTGTGEDERLGFDALPLGDVNGDGLTDYLLTGVDVAYVVAGTDLSVGGRIASLCELIRSIPETAFKRPAPARRNALCDKLDAVAAMHAAGNLEGMASKLEDDIRAKADGSLGGDPDNDWVTDSHWQAFLYPWLEGLARVAANP